MKSEFDMNKVQKVISELKLSDLNAYELQALGKAINGVAESMIYKEIVDKTSEANLLSGGTPTMN